VFLAGVTAVFLIVSGSLQHEKHIRETCTFIETRYEDRPWGGGDLDIYRCAGDPDEHKLSRGFSE